MENKLRVDVEKGGDNRPDAWNDKAFEVVFNLFEEDEEGAEPVPGKQSGLDRSEFAKLVKRIAQL